MSKPPPPAFSLRALAAAPYKVCYHQVPLCFGSLMQSLRKLNMHPTAEWLPRWLRGKESACQCRSCRRHRFGPWVGKILGGGNGNPLQYSCWDNPMDRGAWQAAVHAVTKSWTLLSD